MNCPHCKEILIKPIEDGFNLLRGNAASYGIVGGKLTFRQKCPKCKRRITYSPLMVRLVDGSQPGKKV